MKKIELLAPAGNLEKLKIAIMYGADAVFIGGKQFSLRARANNFDLEDIINGVKFAKKHKAKVYVTMNIVPHDADIINFEKYVKSLEKAKVTGVILTSLSFAEKIKKIAPKLELHLSTQMSIINSDAVKQFADFGFSRIVLGRELNVDQIKDIISKTNTEVEVFIHGGMCASFSGRCMLSNHMTNRDANRGGCAHSCRWDFNLYKDKCLVSQNMFNMGSKDLVGISVIEKLINMNVSSLKIEGRMKSIYYIATIVRAYRMLIDDYYRNKSISNYEYYINEIMKSETRELASGFLEHNVTINEQYFRPGVTRSTKPFVGYVLDYNNITKVAKIEQRNYFEVGDELEFFGPKLQNMKFVVTKILNEDKEEINKANHAQQIIYLNVPFRLRKHDMIRKL
ncbi:MAG: U32 family peptidase [Bacilli bacterium]|jgi:putative protease|nr:U32 family peptidase [Bacilli bacterium]MDD2681504.1 U32 family peptidase [Bacilli bacterium]MDD3121584.1 U32 family peptidase [Bacilli bacterium]MDD4062943.1 U32 family peptidase [Bacilli bacterium]MDD4482301.1 U32 family peptidase [Bacilli bacterium]